MHEDVRLDATYLAVPAIKYCSFTKTKISYPLSHSNDPCYQLIVGPIQGSHYEILALTDIVIYQSYIGLTRRIGHGESDTERRKRRVGPQHMEINTYTTYLNGLTYSYRAIFCNF
jgi:hypothetical protein